jgi:hypothetical protein
MFTNDFSKMSPTIPEKNETYEDINSIIGSPVISSTLKERVNTTVNTKLSIFKYSQGDGSDDDDTIFDL